MNKHTPGPWMIRNPEEAGSSMLGLVGSDGQGFAYTVGLRSERDLANAHLIAAAPELLAALRDVIGWIPGGASEMWHTDASSKAVERARAAIAKAEGK